ncbi:MAG: hypothetical protein HY904_02095 [Deltaproteobacteria bacterium]|nr:hypothetical protein [Deltaproteobacteria bacterium]
MKRRTLVAGYVVALLALAGGGYALTAQQAAQSWGTLPYQGYLERDGAPVNGTADFCFQLWSAPADAGGTPTGSLLWSERQGAVLVAAGTFGVRLGSANPLSVEVEDAPSLFLRVGAAPGGSVSATGACDATAEGDYTMLGGTQQVGSAAYALSAKQAVPGQDFTVGANLGVGKTAPAARLDVAGNANVDGNTNIAGDANIAGRLTGHWNWQILNLTLHANSTRRALPGSASHQMESFTVDKKSPTSLLLIEGTISGFGDASGSMTQAWKLGSGTEVVAQSVNYSASSSIHSRIYPTTVVLSGHTTTGPQTLVFRYYAANGGTGERPFNVYNPSATDDTRLAQTQSVYRVWEIEP